MHCTFLGLQKRILKLLIKLKVNKFCSLKKKRKIVDKRIKKYNYNSKMKRRPRSLSFSSTYKAIEMFNWLFYLSPVVLRSLLKDEEYGFCMVFVYSLSLLWSGCSNEQLKRAHSLLRIYLEDLELNFGENELTINSHQHLHLKKKRFRLWRNSKKIHANNFVIIVL